MPNRLFVPSPLHEASTPRIDTPDEIVDVLAVVTLYGQHRTTELVIGLELGRVIRVVSARRDELSSRARAQLECHEKQRPRFDIHADELYVMDVQAIEKQPDTPGADDPLFLYGMMRGPYPAALTDGVVGVEGQLSTTRGALLDGLALGIKRSFMYDGGRCGTSCIHALVPADSDVSTRAAVLAFPLVPMGEDGTNELVAAQLIHDVLGAMRSDLGDDLANDPVPVPSRKRYEQELVAAGWTIQGDTAVHRGGKSRLASLFSPSKKQKLPREASVVDYVPLIETQLARLPDWPAARAALHDRLGDHGPRKTPIREVPIDELLSPEPPPTPPRKRKPTLPGLPPDATSAPRPSTKPAPPPRPATPPPRQPRPSARRSSNAAPRTVAKGLTPELGAALWMQKLVEQHCEPDRPNPRVTVPARATGAPVPNWMFDLIDKEFPDD